LTDASRKQLVPRPVVWVSVAVALSLLGDSLLYAVLPSQAEVIGVPIGLVGILLSVNRFIRVLSNSWAGNVCDRLGYATPFTAALLLGAATTAVYGLASGFWLLFVARVLWGVSWSFLRVGGLGTVITHANAQNRGLLLGFFLGISRLGSLVAVGLGGLLTDALGYRPTLLIFGALSATAAAISAPAGGRSNALPKAHDPHRQPEQDSDVEPPPGQMLVGMTDMGVRQQLRAVYVCAFAHGFVISGVVTATLGLLLKTLYGPSVTVRGVAFGIATITGLLLSSRWLIDFSLGAYLGHVSDRLGRHRVILAAFLTGALALTVFASVRALGPLSLATVAMFASGTALSAALDASLGDLARPGQQARIIGRYTTFQDLGSACGPLLGYAVGAWLGLGVMYGLSVGLLVAAVGFYGRTCRKGFRAGLRA
jgi:MFS family permease